MLGYLARELQIPYKIFICPIVHDFIDHGIFFHFENIVIFAYFQVFPSMNNNYFLFLTIFLLLKASIFWNLEPLEIC